MMVLIPSSIVGLTFTDTIGLGSILILAMGIAFAGFFGYRDKSWRNAATGWESAFQQQLEEVKILQEKLVQCQHELTLCQTKPDLTDLVLALKKNDESAMKRQGEIMEFLHANFSRKETRKVSE